MLENLKRTSFRVKLVLGIIIIGLVAVSGFVFGKVFLNVAQAWTSTNPIYQFAVVGYTVLFVVVVAALMSRLGPNKTKLKTNWKQFLAHPFKFVDDFNLNFGRFEFNLFKKYRVFRKALLGMAVVAAGFWIFAGWDSCASQVEKLIETLPSFLMGRATWGETVAIYHQYYGCEMHWSAMVIYGLMFAGLSYYYENKLQITGSKNLVYSIGMTLFSIPFFEWTWMIFYVHFQRQPWVLTWQMPQVQILLQNIIFLVVGAYVILYFYADGLRPRLDKVTALLISASVAITLLWVFYPGYVPSLTVETANGVWTNSRHFPQTLYTIDVGSEPGLAHGEWFYVPNDLIHGVNTLAKAIYTFTVFYVACAKRKIERGVRSNVG